ncbi:hypothetical protein AMTRI_Chr02g219180 [Amborella trichopoda]|uniref:Serine aminopeptidase S33 domain-containing protein n=1 Tax=Amborella trichopoda TaxID=13333 RepID=W1P721_AMBTC|nr:caffeoylshikimate esterase [Amborella trichopoda]ERN03396.1 hypothetical protein AMTR_s00003p00257040 [Amborella trichopoda]|eukprot:XP_006841721.1 caffeoylshikimate esterase [Amborella trichopoda]
MSGGEQKYYWGDTPNEEDYYRFQGVRSTSSLYTSPRSLSLFTRSWLPLSSSTRAIILMLHGYGNDISWTFQATAIHLARNGFACFALDLEGHGRSQGLKAYVPNLPLLAQDCLSFFKSTMASNPDLEKLPSFLFGESMGGALCLLIHFLEPDRFNGAVLVAPMCKISDKVRPKWPIPQALTLISWFFPTLPVVPTADLLDKSVKVLEKRVVARRNPTRYAGRPRLGTVVELLRFTDWLSERLSEVKLPFLVVHGSADEVTDPEVSRSLYEAARSEDKSIRVYEGMMHSLLFGETDENVELVRGDILAWLKERCREEGENEREMISWISL